MFDFYSSRRSINYLNIACTERNERYGENCQLQTVYLLSYSFGILLPFEDIIQNFVQKMSKWATMCKTKELQHDISRLFQTSTCK
jgi:hypothetical protein